MAAGGVLVGRGYVSIRPEFEGDWSRSVNARAGSAGRSGASAFSKAFGAGLKGIGALAGIAIGANLASAAAGAAALAPALATAGAAAGALKLGMSGVGDAFKAAFANTSAQASSAASATKAVESAQRGLANAQRALADARVEAAQRVADAQKQVESAERDLADAQRNASDVQKELNGAREEASRALEDMNTRLKESQLDERDAAIRLTEAQKALAVARSNPGTTPEQLAKLQLAYDRALLNLQEQKTETKRLSEDTKKANKAGVEGSQQVLQVKDKISQANREVADKERALADAQAGVDQARKDGQRQIADAQRAVADAAAAVADAQAAAAAQTSKLDQAMAKLAPNAQSFVRAVQSLAPAWTDMRLSVQNELFKGLDATVTSLGRTTIPILKRQLTDTAGVWNEIAKSAASGITEMAKSGQLDQILAGATKNLAVFKDTPKQIITAFGQLAVAAQPAFNGLLTQFAGAITSFTDGIAKSFASGGLQQAIDTAFGILSQFGTLLGNAFGVVSQIFKAASDAGGQIVGVLGSVFGELKKILAAPEMQAAMRSLFESVAQIVGAIVPVIGSVVQAVVPLLAAIAGPIANLAQVLGPVLQQLVSTLGAALTPIIQALMPVIVQVGLALIQVVEAVTPLLKPIADLISGVITALAPALTPVIQLVTMLVDALVGPLSQVVTALTPVFIQLGTVISEIFAAFQPFLAPLVDMIGQIAGLVAGVLAQAFSQLMKALGPLIPVGIQLIQDVFAALQPVLPVLVDAFGKITKAMLSLIGPIGGIVSELGKSLAPVIADLAPVLAQVAALFAGALAQALPPLAAAFLTLVQALNPLWPLIGQLVGQVVTLASGLLVQLLPSIVQLALAVIPLIPSLAKIAALILELAVKVLSWLLPPLLQLAGFLVGVFAGALKVVIGWITSIVKWISTLVGWVVDHLVPAFLTLRDKGIQAWNTLKSGLSTAWGAIKTYVLYPIRDFFTKTIPGWATTVKNKVVGAFNGARDGLSTAWGSIKTHTLYPIRDFFTKTIPGWGTTLKNGMVGAFEEARKGIKIAWDKLKNVAKVPVAFVVNTVYNDGLRKVWNLVTDAFGGKHLDPIKGFATGGIMPGYTPGRDVHMVPSTRGPVALSGGEAIMRPEWTRAVGPSYVAAMNAAARSGGVAGVRGALGYKDGGIFSGIGDALGGAWDKVKSGYNWLKDTFSGALKAGVTHVVNPLINKIPGGNIGFVGILKDAMKNLALKLVGAGKKADELSTPKVNYTPSKGVEQWRPVVLKALDAVHQSRGLAQSTLRRMQQESGGNPTIVNKWDCLTLDAMILTQRGWLKHDEVREGDLTIGYNSQAGRSEWTRVTRVVHYADAPLVRMGNSRWSATTTPNHRWVNLPATYKRQEESIGGSCPHCEWPQGTRRRGNSTAGGLRIHLAKAHGIKANKQQTEIASKAQWVTTEAIRAQDRLLLSAPAATESSLDVTIEEAALLGWIAGDGHIEKPCPTPEECSRHGFTETGICRAHQARQNPSMSIAQSKPEMVEKLRALLANIPHSVYMDDRPTRMGNQAVGPRHVFRIGYQFAQDLLRRAGHPRDNAVNQVLAMSSQQREAWLEAVIDAEGHRAKADPGNKPQVVIYQRPGAVLDAITLAVYLTGSRPRVAQAKRKGQPDWSPEALVRVNNPIVTGHSLKREDAGRGEVWCVTTELGSWTARQGDHIFLTGNSNWQAGHPSVGLMQVIGPTFRSYAGKYKKTGPFLYGTSVNPMANIYSSMKYALGAYGSLSRAYDRPGGYDSGGWLGPGQSGVNNLRQPEAVLTPTQWSTMTTLAERSTLGGLQVAVYVGNEQITDIARAEVRTAQGELIQVLDAS